MAFCNLPCWTNFSAALRTFCLLNPKPNAIGLRTPAPCVSPFRGERTVRTATPARAGSQSTRTKVIVRLASQNRMVTKDYQKGVYKWGEGIEDFLNWVIVKLNSTTFRKFTQLPNFPSTKYIQALAAAACRSISSTSSRCLGSRRRIFHEMKPTDDPPRAPI